MDKLKSNEYRVLQLALGVAVLLASYVLGVQGLNADVIWFDELTSIGHAGGLTGAFTPLDVIASVSQISPKHAPLFFETLAIWGRVLGWHQVILRVVPLFFGVITVAWVYRIGKDIGGWRVGFWSAVVMGLNVFWVEYYHEIRMYSMQIMFIMMMIWHYYFLGQSNRASRWYHWFGLIFSATASLYTQPFSFFVHVAIGLYHVLFAPKKHRWLKITLAFVLVGLLYLPWLPTTYTGLTTKFDTSTDPMLFQTAVQVFVRLLSNGMPLLMLGLMVLAVMQLRHRAHRRQMLFAWIMAGLIVVLLLITNETIGLIPMRRARYFFVAWGMWSVVMGIGLAHIRYQWLAVGLVVVYLVSGFALRDAEDYVDYQGTIFAVDYYPPMQDYVDALKGITRAHDFVVGFTDANFVNSDGKHGKSTADYYMEVQLGTGGTFIPTHFSPETLEDDIPEKLANHPYLLVTYNPQEMPKNFDVIMDIIQRNYMSCDVLIDGAGLFVQRYVNQVIGCDHVYTPIVYDNGVTIVDYFVDYDPVQATVDVVTGWTVDDDHLLDEYNVSIQIVTADWQSVGQADRHLYDDILKWYRAELPTDVLPAGDYRVMVVVYDRETNEKVNGVDMITNEVGTILPLAVFTVESS